MFEKNDLCLFSPFSSLKTNEKSIQIYMEIICKNNFFSMCCLWPKILCRGLYHIITDEYIT